MDFRIQDKSRLLPFSLLLFSVWEYQHIALDGTWRGRILPISISLRPFFFIFSWTSFFQMPSPRTTVILLMEEILHHMKCIKPYEYRRETTNLNRLAGFVPSTVNGRYFFSLRGFLQITNRPNPRMLGKSLSTGCRRLCRIVSRWWWFVDCKLPSAKHTKVYLI